MRRGRRKRLKAISRWGWQLFEEGRDTNGRYRLELCGPSGERLTLTAISRPRCFLQAEQLIVQKRRGVKQDLAA